MKNKQKFTLVYAAPGFFNRLRKGKNGEETIPAEEPEYPSCYDEEPEAEPEARPEPEAGPGPEEFVCVYASPEWFEKRGRERRGSEEFLDVYASPEWFAGKKGEPEDEQKPDIPEKPEPRKPGRIPAPHRPIMEREPVFRALYAAPERFPKAGEGPVFERVYAGPRVPDGERVTIEAGRERCRKCGYPTVAGAKFCFNCGAKLPGPGNGCVEI